MGASGCYVRRFSTEIGTLPLFLDYIEVFYNRRRRYTSLGYLSSAEF